MDKVCVNHPESPSVGSCKACEKPVCLMCIVEVQGVSFCSEACGSAYQEVKDWLERPAADEEWNPLAEAKSKAEPAPSPVAAAPEAPAAASRKTSPSGTEMRAALDSALGSDTGKISAPPPPPPAAQADGEAPSRSNASLYIGIAATVLIVVGAYFLFTSDAPPPTPPGPPVAVNNPPKPEPPKPPPPKPEPPKPDPVKPPPPKPEPPKPDPVKPPPPKPEPPKPAPVKPPDPPKPPPPPPPKPEPPKPDPVKPPPPKPEPPKPDPVKPEPPPAPHLAFLRDPWGKEKPGAWYRIKTVSNGQESYRDIGLRESGAGYRVLVSQINAGGKTEPEQFTWTEPEDASVFGSVNGDAQGTKFTADVVRMKSARPSQYVLKDGPHAGVSFPSDAVLTRLDLQPVKVKTRTLDCSVIETELKDPKRSVRTWFSVQFPLGAVKSESEGTTTALVDYGDDWAKRPAFPEPPVIAKIPPPPPKPEPPKPEPPPPPKPEPPKPEPPKPPPPPPPKPEPPKPEPPPPPKPEPPKPEPPKPPPPPPPKPEPPKPEPPPPPKPEPPPPPKPEPPKPEPPKPPPPPPPKPEPPKPEPVKPPVDSATRVKKSMADAAGLIREATPMYQEVAGAMNRLPDDQAALRELVSKAERVSLKLGDARILYTSVKADAPDPAVLDRRLAQLDELLASVQECVKELKKRIE